MNTIRNKVLINMQIFSLAAIPIHITAKVMHGHGRDILYLAGHGWVFQVTRDQLFARDTATLSMHWRPL